MSKEPPAIDRDQFGAPANGYGVKCRDWRRGKMMRVQDIVTSQVIGVIVSASVAEATGLMVEHKISGLPVVDASRPA